MQLSPSSISQIFCFFILKLGLLGDKVVKNPPANAEATGDAGSIPGSGRSPGVGNGNPLQYSCLENSMDRGVWQATIHGIARSWTQVSDLSTQTETLFPLNTSSPARLALLLLFQHTHFSFHTPSGDFFFFFSLNNWTRSFCLAFKARKSIWFRTSWTRVCTTFHCYNVGLHFPLKHTWQWICLFKKMFPGQASQLSAPLTSDQRPAVLSSLLLSFWFPLQCQYNFPAKLTCLDLSLQSSSSKVSSLALPHLITSFSLEQLLLHWHSYYARKVVGYARKSESWTESLSL